MNRTPNLLLRSSFTVCFLVLVGLSKPATAQSSYVEGVSAVLSSTNASEIDTWSETYLTPDIAYYYGAYVEGYLYQNGSLIASGYADRNPYENDAYGELSEPLVVGDIYTIESDHYIVAYYVYGYDSYGNPEYWNPDYFLVSNDGGSPDPSGWNFTPGGGPEYYDVEYLYLGTTGVQISSAAPHISGLSQSGASLGSSGSVTVNGSDLTDIFTGEATPAITGSGVSLSVQSQSSTQVVLNYTVAADASIGAQNLTLSTRFGTSNSATFTIGYPPAVVTSISPSIWTAGQSNLSVTITGQNFGTSPTLSLNGSGVYLAGYTPNANGQSIQATVDIAANAPNESVTVTVQPGYAGSSFVCNCQGQSPNGTNTVTVQAVTPAPQIMFNSTNISGSTQSVFAGQQIALSVPTPPGYNVQSQSWTINGARTGGFTNTAGTGPPSNSGGGKKQGDPALNQSSLTFYWVHPGDVGNTVNYTYTLDNGQSASATATFNIQGPTGSLLPSVTVAANGSGVQVVRNTKLQILGVPYQNGQVGATFTTAATPPNGAGTNASFMWLQLIANEGTTVINSIGQVDLPQNPSSGLDGTYPYFNGTATGTYDSPSSNLPPNYGELYHTFDATMYSLWDPALPSGCHPATTSTDGCYTQTPSTCTSIPIPLGSVRWRWNGCAINTLIQPAGQDAPNWVLSCGFSQTYTPQPSDYPQWAVTVNPLGSTCQ